MTWHHLIVALGRLSADHADHPNQRKFLAEEDSVAALKSPLPPFVGAYEQVDPNMLPITTRVVRFEGQIDHIFVSTAAHVAAVLAPPYVNDKMVAKGASFPVMPQQTAGWHLYVINPPLSQFCVMPNAIWPSDHLAIGVRLLLK